MHWFWRTALAVFVAMAGYALTQRLPLLSWGYRGDMLLLVNLMSVLAAVLIGITAYGVLTRKRYQKHLDDAETRCRKCGYILRGITEPRCPECGERI
jgi:uncharacterized paraquat-inducible protein A